MNPLRTLRWKLVFSHLVIIVVAIAVLLITARVLAAAQFEPADLESIGGATELNSLAGQTIAATATSRTFQSIVEESLLIASFAALAVAVVVSLFVSHRVVQPLQVLTQVSRRMAQGAYHERTVLPSDDELAELSHSINQLAEALEHTEQRRMTLIADVAHELRTPLTTIEGYMEAMLDGAIQPSPQAYSLVLRESVRLQRLVSELALLSRIEANEITLRPEAVSLNEIVATIRDQMTPLCDAQQISFVCDVPASLPPLWADRDRLMQILINLLSNALHYTPSAGRIMLLVEEAEESAHLVIQDSGVGITAEHLPHVFERFYRVDKSRTRSSGGTGIGLTIVRHLVYAHGGEVWAESEGHGTGAAFHLTLPLALTADTAF